LVATERGVLRQTVRRWRGRFVSKRLDGLLDEPRPGAPCKRLAPKKFHVHLILDNYSTHKTPMIHRWLARRPRFHLHFTPTGASWINLLERWFAALTEKQLCWGVYRSTRELETAIRRYIETNGKPKPFVWTKTADEILCQHCSILSANLSNSGH
jgi:transposase